MSCRLQYAHVRQTTKLVSGRMRNSDVALALLRRRRSMQWLSVGGPQSGAVDIDTFGV